MLDEASNMSLLTAEAAPTSASPILVVATCWYAYVARTAHLLLKAGCSVAVLCPKGHPVLAIAGISVFEQQAMSPLRSLSQAIATCNPCLVVPTDDRSVANLHALHRAGSASQRRLIERSLGDPAYFGVSACRSKFLTLAGQLEIPAPAGRSLANEAELAQWVSRIAGPWVLKIDGAWGGQGVRIVQTAEEARQASRKLRKFRSRAVAVKRILVNQDLFWLADWLRAGTPELSVQSYIKGMPGNLTMFCRNGEVLAMTMAEAVACACETGPATIIRLVQWPDLAASARRLAARMRLNGFHGLDFMVEETTGRAIVIEMNPRLTSLSNIRLEPGRDLIGAAAAMVTNKAYRPPETQPRGDLVANFPIAWEWSLDDPRLPSCYADVPRDEPALMAEMLRPSWPDRLPLARLVRGCSRAAYSAWDTLRRLVRPGNVIRRREPHVCLPKDILAGLPNELGLS